jgi:hypothetical protein
MKIEYAGICANVLKHCPLPCTRCVFNQTFVCTSRPNFNYISCGLNGFEKDPGYIFKV